jgi:hypothetical protein
MLALVGELQSGVGMSMPSYDWVRLAQAPEVRPALSIAGAVLCALVIAALTLVLAP